MLKATEVGSLFKQEKSLLGLSEGALSTKEKLVATKSNYFLRERPPCLGFDRKEVGRGRVGLPCPFGRGILGPPSLPFRHRLTMQRLYLCGAAVKSSLCCLRNSRQPVGGQRSMRNPAETYFFCGVLSSSVRTV